VWLYCGGVLLLWVWRLSALGKVLLFARNPVKSAGYGRNRRVLAVCLSHD
jgi:hypothetical protein